MTETLLERTLRHEGFREKPYLDSEDVLTIGHGLTYLTEDESKYIVHLRLDVLQRRLLDEHQWLPGGDVLHVMAEMCFQLGWTGCHNFKRMWAALETENYGAAANEMLDSRWHKQTKGRCEELASIIRELA